MLYYLYFHDMTMRHCRKETRPRFYLRLVDDAYSFFLISFLFSFPSFPLFLSLFLSLTDENSATDCSPVQRSFAISNKLGVHFHVSVTVHSNRQSSLHPPPSGASFVNAQSPPRQENYRARRIGSYFPRLATKRSLLAEINLMLRITIVMIFFPLDLIKMYTLLRHQIFKENDKNVILRMNNLIFFRHFLSNRLLSIMLINLLNDINIQI